MVPTARLPETLPTPPVMVLCLFVFGSMAFAKFMQRPNGSGAITDQGGGKQANPPMNQSCRMYAGRGPAAWAGVHNRLD